jgi:hypothetical protein
MIIYKKKIRNFIKRTQRNGITIPVYLTQKLMRRRIPGCEEDTPFFKELRRKNLVVVQDQHGKWVTRTKKSVK